MNVDNYKSNMHGLFSVNFIFKPCVDSRRIIFQNRFYVKLHYRKTLCVKDSSEKEAKISLSEDFCLIENRDSVRDFSGLPLEDIKYQIELRRTRIFLLLEEVRRLKIQQRLKGYNSENDANPIYASIVPYLKEKTFLNEGNIQKYYALYIVVLFLIIIFGGLIAPSVELKMGLGGQSYLDFIHSMNLPEQLAKVDPIVASFCGGAVGSLSTVLIFEISSIQAQQWNRCFYCKGSGYLTCATCIGTGIENENICTPCSGTGKVMCTNCFCTGKHMVTEHDPRFDPFD